MHWDLHLGRSYYIISVALDSCLTEHQASRGSETVKRYLNFTSLFVVLLLTAYVGLTAFKLPGAPKQEGSTPNTSHRPGTRSATPSSPTSFRTAASSSTA